MCHAGTLEEAVRVEISTVASEDCEKRNNGTGRRASSVRESAIINHIKTTLALPFLSGLHEG